MDKTRRTVIYKIVIATLCLMLLGTFWFSAKAASDPVSLTVQPTSPREGEPVISTYKLNNPTSEPIKVAYQFYANGELITSGATSLAPLEQKVYQFAYENQLKMGEQINFVVNTQSGRGEFTKSASLPQYSPQIWSSFVSFASFSTTVMSSMSTMVYYNESFGGTLSPNVGTIMSLVLIALLIFMEITGSLLATNQVTVIGRLRSRFLSVNWILLIIVMGIVYTTAAMLIFR